MILAGELYPEPVIAGSRCAVAQHRDGLVHVTDHQVNATIIVEITECDPASNVLGLEVVAALLGPLLEFAVAGVAQQHGTLASSNARSGREADGVAIGDHQIFPAVVVDIQETSAPADILLADDAQSRGGGAVGEVD